MRSTPPPRRCDHPGAVTADAATAVPSRTYRLIAALSRPLVRGLYRLQVDGLEHLPANGGFVVAANHSSNLDAWPLCLALWPRPVHFMVKQEAWWPPLGWLLAAAGMFPVRRGSADVGAVATATGLCRDGHVMAMFPEGTRRAKGLRKRRAPRPHAGAAFIALQAGVPLVPAALGGMDRLRHFGPVSVRFGPALPLGELREREPRAAADELTRRLWVQIQSLEATLAVDRESPGQPAGSP